MDRTEPSPLLWCLAAAALFGATTPAAKALLGSVGPVTLAGLLYLGAAAGVLPWALRDRSAGLPMDPVNLGRLAGAVVLGGGLGPILLVLGLSRAPAASVSLWLTLEPVATVALAGLLFREHLGRRVVGASALTLAGSVTLCAPSGFATAGAAALVALACLCWAVDNNLTARLDAIPPARTTLAKGLVAGSVNLAVGLATEDRAPAGTALAWALAAGAVGYGASMVLAITAAQRLGAARSQMVLATAPFLGTLAAWSILGEAIRPFQVASAGLMAAGVSLLATEHHGHPHTHEATVHTHRHTHDDGHHDHPHDGDQFPAGPRVQLLGALSPGGHVHPHAHEAITHDHPHHPDLHHRHPHGG